MRQFNKLHGEFGLREIHGGCGDKVNNSEPDAENKEDQRGPEYPAKVSHPRQRSATVEESLD